VARDLPRVREREPVVGHLDLSAVADNLLEDPVVVADAVAPRRQVQRRHAVEEAGSQAPEAAIPERRVLLLLVEVLEAVA
jgi:hypothetical protein